MQFSRRSDLPYEDFNSNVTRFLHEDDARALYDGTIDLDQVVSPDLIRGTQDRVIGTVQQPLLTDPDDLAATTDRKKFADAPENFQYLNCGHTEISLATERSAQRHTH